MLKTGQELVAMLRPQVQEISVQALHEALKQQPQSIVIDIRESAETAQGSLLEAIAIPRGILEMQIGSYPAITERISVGQTLAEQPLYLMCRSGARSVLAACSLQQMGFKNVYSVAGGYLAWQAAGFTCSDAK